MRNLDFNLIKKYHVSGPRYTSYPTALQFREAGERDLQKVERYLVARNTMPRRLSLYVHIPFCFSLCWYCGCTKVISKDQNRGDIYLDYLEREMERIGNLIHPESKVIQIHFGGGTPTFLKADQLLRLGEAIRKRFNISENAEYGVEIDPRRCSRKQIAALKTIGCNRASLGVQDTNPDVQQAIHRIQPFEQTVQVVQWLREHGIDSINLDLIYGLPRQTPVTLRQSMQDALGLKPDRLAVYSYAHVPEIMPAQKLLNADEMPSTDEKLAMLQLTISHLTANGYRFIGMDHFSRGDEELATAMDNGSLQRNFQGYSTHSGADLYAFGMSGISNVGDYYWQNTKDLNTYYREGDNGRLPVAKILQLSEDDMIRHDVIMRIMCRMELLFLEIEEEWDIVFVEYFREELRKLVSLQEDGLVRVETDKVTITEQGRLFLRNVAMCFDHYLQNYKAGRSFSKTV